MSDTTRLDFRIPNDLLEEVRDIAKNRFNAKIHHISKQPETTPTLIQLIQYGIQFLEQGLPDSNLDNLPDKTIKTLIEQVTHELSNYPDKETLTNHPTIKAMQTHIEKLDSCMVDLTRAIKELKEVKTEKSDPLEKKPSENALEDASNHNQDISPGSGRDGYRVKKDVAGIN